MFAQEGGVVLPRGIGIVRVNTPGKPLVVVSSRLTCQEALVARAVAYVLSVREGKHIVVLRESMIAGAAEA